MDAALVTRLVGTAGYLLAGTGCALAVRRTKGTPRKWWIVLLVLAALLTLDLQLNVRFIIATSLGSKAMQEHWYGERFPVQKWFDIGAAATCFVGWLVALILTRRHRWALWVALSGAALAVLVLLVEIISLHPVDELMYTLIGPVMTIALAWLMAGVMMGLGGAMARPPRA